MFRIFNTSNVTAYFDIRYTEDDGNTFTTQVDGLEVSSNGEKDIYTQVLSNDIGQSDSAWVEWRAATTNPNSGSYNIGSYFTISGCP